ncbi:HNH endonuclease [Polymorphospora rubra]|uniref:HNH endonuclease n=1 Tax=Polymorphospora rubra TaxID=338584 RepID=UPI0033C5045B
MIFTTDGFPDFSPYATHTVTFDPHFLGNHGTDFTEANRKAGLSHTPRDHTWHHHQDARTMQLVPTDLHRAVNHAGGVAIMKGRSAES